MIRLLLLLALLIAAPLQADEYQVNEIYETYMPADKLLPVLEPMLGPEDKITAFRNKLIVRAPKDRQDKLLAILQEIDRPLHNILIEVRYGNSSTSQGSTINASVRYEDANKGVEINSGSQPSDRVVIYQGSSVDDKIRVRTVAKSHFTTQNEDTLSQIRVLEGSEGFLQVGEEVPQNHFVLLHPNGFGTTTEYRMMGNGLYVIPQIVKDKIRLELSTVQRKRKSASNTVEKTDAQSVLLVEPDIWTPFAGASSSTTTQQGGKVLSTRDLKDNQNRNLELKVTILD